MLVKQWRWYPGTGWSDPTIPIAGCHLVLAFGTRARLEDPDLQHILEVLHGPAPLVGCASVDDADGGGTIGQGLVVTAVRFERSRVRVAVGLLGVDDSFAEGRRMAAQLEGPDLQHLFVFSDGPRDHRSELVRGIRDGLSGGAAMPGWLVCAANDFEPSWVMVSNRMGPQVAVALGLHRTAATGGEGKVDGWAAFGPRHQVAAPHDSVLRELEGADGA